MGNRKESFVPVPVPALSPLLMEFLANAEEGVWVEDSGVRAVRVREGIRLEKPLEKPLTSAAPRARAAKNFKEN